MGRVSKRRRNCLQSPALRQWIRDIAYYFDIDRAAKCDRAIMALRRNPQRRCKIEGLLSAVVANKSEAVNMITRNILEPERAKDGQRERRTDIGLTIIQRHEIDTSPSKLPRVIDDRPFPFFELPQEIRDEIYAYLVVRRSSSREPTIAATSILKNRKKRSTAQAARERVNRQRISSGKRPVCARTTNPEPVIESNLLQVSQQMYREASDCLYSSNWLAISLSKLPSTAIETPYGWDLSRIKRLRLELQIKDALRMNSYIDWTAFFSAFSSLRFLHIIPTFHPRYYDWAYTELYDWRMVPYIYKAFFRELLVAIPDHVDLRLGTSLDTARDMELQGKSPLGQTFLLDMYRELGSRCRNCTGDGSRPPIW